MSRIFISAAHKSSGKTTISIGLCAALTQRNLQVRAFKKGPDYIDPLWLSQATGHACHNLDFYTMRDDEIRATFDKHSAGGDIALIEGNKGLYDGLDLDGSNSNAALAKLLRSPVILVIDARGMTRGIAPLILGYQQFDPDVQIAGVILNQLGGSRHEKKLRAVIEHYTDVPVLGAVHRNHELEIVERHLGLIPSNELDSAKQQISRLGNIASTQIDLDKILTIAQSAPALATNQAAPAVMQSDTSSVRIGIARDAAFGFYYPGDLEQLEASGAQLVFFDALHDAQLPNIDGLFIGGGFPETQMQALQANRSLRESIRNAINNGLPCYAECGGLMYLARSLTWKEQTCEMVGVIPGDIVMHDRPQGRGYIQLAQTRHHPWPIADTGQVLAAHEFHYSALSHIPDNLQYAYDVTRGTGIDGVHDGIVMNNLLACYAHLRDTAQSPWAQAFVQFVHTCKKGAN